MSKENVKLVLSGYEAFNRGDLEAATDAFHPDIEWVVLSVLPEDRVYRGIEDVRRFWGLWSNTFEDFMVEIEEVMDAGERVIVMASLTGTGRGSGADVRSPAFPHVWTIRDGKALRMEMLLTKAEALEAAGLSESAMPEENVEIVARLVDAWNQANVEAMLALFDPECEVIFSPEVPEPGPFHGPTELREWAEGFLAAWESHHAEVVELIETDHSIVAILHLIGRGSGSGIEMDETDAHVFTFSDGKVTRWRNFSDRSEALEAAGLSE